MKSMIFCYLQLVLVKNIESSSLAMLKDENSFFISKETCYKMINDNIFIIIKDRGLKLSISSVETYVSCGSMLSLENSTNVLMDLSNNCLSIIYLAKVQNQKMCRSLKNSLYYSLDHLSNVCPNEFWIVQKAICVKFSCNNIVKTVLQYESDKSPIQRQIRQEILIVATIQYLPFVNKTIFANGTIKYDGLLFEMLNIISNNLNFKYRVVEPEDMTYGAMTANGSFNGLIGMLQNRKVDIVVAALTMTYERSLAVTFSSQFHLETIGILVRASNGSSSLVQLFLIFSPNVWVAIFASTLATAIIIFFERRFHLIQNDGIMQIMLTSSWLVFSILANQITILKGKTWSKRIMKYFYRIFIIILCTSYICKMISHLTLTKTSLPFKDLDGLLYAIKNDNFKVCVHKSTAFYSAVMSNDSKYAAIKNFLLNNQMYANDFASCQKFLVEDPNVAYLGEVSYLQTVQTTYCQIPLVLLKETFFPGYFGLAFQRDILLSKQVSKGVTEIVERGFVQMWKLKYTNKTNCKLNDVNDAVFTGAQQLGLPEMMAAFILFLGGIGISMFFFFLEKSTDNLLTKKSTTVIYLHK